MISLVEQVILRGDKSQVRATEELLRRMLQVLIDLDASAPPAPPGLPSDEARP